MKTLWILLLCGGVIALFWYRRKVAETARLHAQRQAEQLGVQFVSVACKQWRLAILSNGKLGIRSRFMFEFSSDGETLYEGELWLENERLRKADIPPHRI